MFKATQTMLWLGNKICEKDWVFPIKIHITFVILCKDTNATVGYRNWLETWTSRCDVRVYYLYRVKIEKRKASIRDLMTNSSSYTRDSFLEIRQKWKKK